MGRIFRAAALLLIISAPAQASQWYVFNVQDDICVTGADAARQIGSADIATPGSYADLLRSIGKFPTIKRLASRHGLTVRVTSSDNVGVYFFTDSADCEEFKAKAEQAGAVVTPDLR